jgi:uncharacterized RDD family membrane protein YckC
LLVMLYDAVAVIALLMLATALALLVRPQGATAMRDPGYTAYLLLVWFAYLAWCWRSGGMTLGMRAWKVRIVDEAGQQPTWLACAIRFGVSLLSAAVLGAGFAWIAIDEKKRAWHDRVSRTKLIRFTPPGARP